MAIWDILENGAISVNSVDYYSGCFGYDLRPCPHKRDPIVSCESYRDEPCLISVLHGISGMQILRILRYLWFWTRQMSVPYFPIIPYHSLTPRSMKSGGEHSCHSSSRARKGTLSAWKEQLVHGKSSVLVRAGDPKFCWLENESYQGGRKIFFKPVSDIRQPPATCHLLRLLVRAPKSFVASHDTLFSL